MASISGPRSVGDFTYLEAGAACACPVVFLHGIGGGSGLFMPQLEAFADRYRAIAWNMPGYGGSTPIEPGGIDAYAQALKHFLTALRLVRPVLVGHSIGGMVVQSFLGLGLASIRGAVLAQTSPAFGGRDPLWADNFVRARLGPLDQGATMASIAEASVAGLVGPGADPAGVALARAAMADTPAAAFRASTLAMIGFDRRNDLARIAVPTLLIAGSEDTNAPAATMAKMAERVPGSRFVTLAGCGHLAMLEQPVAFNAALRDFLDSVSDTQ